MNNIYSKLFVVSLLLIAFSSVNVNAYADFVSSKDLRAKMRAQDKLERELELEKVEFLKKNKEAQNNTNYLIQNLLFEQQILNTKVAKLYTQNSELISLMKSLIREVKKIETKTINIKKIDGLIEDSMDPESRKFFEFTP